MHNLLPLFIAAGFLVMSLASFRLNRAAQPLRLEFAEKSQALLVNPKIPKTIADFVRSLQKMTFGARGMLIFALFAVPVLAAGVFLFPALVEKSGRRFWIECPEARAQFDEVNRLHDRIMFFNNPLLLFTVACEMIVFMAPAILLHAIFRGAISVRFNTDVARNLIEEKSIKLRSAVPKLSFAQ